MNNNKYALITGASSGIGYEFALRLDSLGYNTIIVARRESKLIELKNKLKNESLYCNEDVDTDSPMVTLSTCDLDYGLHSNRRLLLSGFLDEYDETIIVH